MAVPVRPLPELQCTTMTFSGSSERFSILDKLTFQPFPGGLCDLEKVNERGTVVVRPVEVSNPATEVLLLIISGAFRSVKNPVIVSVLAVQEVRDLGAGEWQQNLPA